MIDFIENSPVSILDFAFQASGGDGVVSDEEIRTLTLNNEQLIYIFNRLGVLSGLNDQSIETEEQLANEYLSLVSNNEVQFSLENFNNASERITAISLQPLALAFALKVAGSDGLHTEELKLINAQKEEWSCEDEDIDHHLSELDQ